jgi:hypothetical protein
MSGLQSFLVILLQLPSGIVVESPSIVPLLPFALTPPTAPERVSLIVKELKFVGRLFASIPV